MNKSFLFLLAIGWALICNAQPSASKQPSWITNLPKEKAGSYYYYRVTIGEGVDYDKAYAKAFARAIMESSWKLGVDVNTTDDLQTIEEGIMDNVKVAPSHMTLPMNKVCEYTEKLVEKRGIRIYILWQVAKYGNVLPNFDEFTNCE